MYMNNQEFKLSFNHPVKEIYPWISSNGIKYVIKKKDETDYKTKPIPNDVFFKILHRLFNK